jgi:subtilisin family serine protease
MKRYVVSLHNGDDAESFHSDMIDEKGSEVVPSRQVEISKLREGSRVNFEYFLSQEEADMLRFDSRVRSVELKPTDNPFIKHEQTAVQTSNFTKPDTQWWESYVNWGLLRCNSVENIYGTSKTAPTNEFAYNLSGKNVDIVIMDSGVQANHPEFIDKDGNSRVKQINWPQMAGISSITQPSNHHRDNDGHGTHVAAIAAGKTYGWAKDANIYPIHINLGPDQGGFDPDDAFDLIINWHKRKGNNNPTIVNMSWGLTVNLPFNINITGGRYREQNWSFNPELMTRNYLYENFGIVEFGDKYYRFPGESNSYNASVDEMIAEGIHVVIAGGNLPVRSDVLDGIDYFNNIEFTYLGVEYLARTNRPMSPYSPNAFNVGAMSATTDENGLDRPWINTTRGPAVDVYAPGENIMSAYSDDATLYFRPSATYYFDNAFRQAVLTGTSMAAPQITGQLTYVLQQLPDIEPNDLKKLARNRWTLGRISNTSNDDDWKNRNGSLFGGIPYVLYNQYNQPLAGEFINVDYAYFSESG